MIFQFLCMDRTWCRDRVPNLEASTDKMPCQALARQVSSGIALCCPNSSVEPICNGQEHSTLAGSSPGLVSHHGQVLLTSLCALLTNLLTTCFADPAHGHRPSLPHRWCQPSRHQCTPRTPGSEPTEGQHSAWPRWRGTSETPMGEARHRR